MAWAVQGFGGLFVDANAISPATAREIAVMVEEGGGRPTSTAGSSAAAAAVARAAAPACTCPAPRRQAAAGCSTARAGRPGHRRGAWPPRRRSRWPTPAWTKGTAALLLAARALARAEGVEDALLAEWALSQPALADRSRGAARSATAKGWRWVAEMEEIAASMASAGLPDGFHQAAAEIFRRSPRAGSGMLR